MNNDYNVFLSDCRFSAMSVKLEDVLKDENLIKNIEEIAKDTALLHGVLMRTKETPNSPDVRARHCFICLEEMSFRHLRALFIQAAFALQIEQK